MVGVPRSLKSARAYQS